MTDPAFRWESIEQYKYRLTERYSILTPFYGEEDHVGEWVSLMRTGELIIEPAYLWDGASFIALDSPSSMRASLVHDACYQLLREEVLPPTMRTLTDELLAQVAVEDGMYRWRARMWVVGLRYFGGPAARARKGRKAAA